jgi:hypothetical protein
VLLEPDGLRLLGSRAVNGGVLREQPGDPGVYRHAAVSCRTCGAANDAVTHPYGLNRVPKDGDVSICRSCGEVSLFVIGPFGVALREPTLQEMSEIVRQHGPLLRRAALQRARRGPR